MIPIPRKTRYAERYGAGPDDVQSEPLIIKSGFTPLTPAHPQTYLETDQRIEQKMALEDHQRTELQSFTSLELQNLDAISNRCVKQASLTNPILPFLARNRWNNVALKDSTGSRHDAWTVKDPAIWKTMVPILRLASLFITNFYQNPWFHALLLEKYEDMPLSRFTEKDRLNYGDDVLQEDYKRFTLRKPNPNNEAECRKMMESLISVTFDRHLRLGFMGDIHPDDGSDLICVPSGFTYANNAHPAINLWLPFRAIAPALKWSTTDAELLSIQLHTAVTVFHEIIHATYHALSHHRPPLYPLLPEEPYFMDEEQAELGMSAENAFFGGTVFKIHGTKANSPPFVLMWRQWPFETGGCPVLEPGCAEARYIPLTITYAEALLSCQFWSGLGSKIGMIRTPSPIMESLGNELVSREVTIEYGHHNLAASAVTNLISLNAPQKAEYAIIMKTQKLTDLYVAIKARDTVAEKVGLAAEKCMDSERHNILTKLNKLGDLTGQLLVVYRQLIEVVNNFEDADKVAYVDVRNGFHSYNRSLRKFLHQWTTTRYPGVNTVFSNALIALEELCFISGHTVPNQGNVTEEAALESEDAINLLTAIAAIDRGNQETCKTICDSLISDLGTSLVNKSYARILRGRVQNLPNAERLADMKIAISALQSIAVPIRFADKHDNLLREAEIIRGDLELIDATEKLNAPLGAGKHPHLSPMPAEIQTPPKKRRGGGLIFGS